MDIVASIILLADQMDIIFLRRPHNGKSV